MSQTRRNEGKCCDAVLRVLEHRLNTQRTDLHVPDRADRTSQRVDVCVALGGERYVLEHTRIEPFVGATETGVFLGEFMNPIKERLTAPLPGPAFYDLKLPQDPRFDRGGRGSQRRIAKAQEALAEFVSAEAPSLYERALASGCRGMASTAQEIPGLTRYLARLTCSLTGKPSAVDTGQFGTVRNVDDNLEEQRIVRLRKALADKCPKLQHCKYRGARTVLVLEDDDIALSNSVVVREALNRAGEERTDLPDEIYLVETKVNTWYMWPMNSAAIACFPRDFDIECKVLESTDLDDLMCKRNSSFQCDVCLGH